MRKSFHVVIAHMEDMKVPNTQSIQLAEVERPKYESIAFDIPKKITLKLTMIRYNVTEGTLLISKER